MNTLRPITLLWALRSICPPMNCTYCYYGTLELAAPEQAAPARPGQLSHHSPNDMTADEVLAFAATIADSGIGRVFLSGGEPLAWRPIFKLVELLKSGGTEVIVCTSGIGLSNRETSRRLVDLGVDAVSVSLDHTDPDHNDLLRQPRQPGGGHIQVTAGIRTLLQTRGERTYPRVGIYSVITRDRIDQIPAMAHFARDLGCDYYIPQPVTLEPDHPLYGEMTLTQTDIPALRAAFGQLSAARLPLTVPGGEYPAHVAFAATRRRTVKPACFGGHTLAFAQPDGAVWDCVSTLKIAATPPDHLRTLRGADAAELFPAPTRPAADCPLFSYDCVNMGPLMGFDTVLTAEPAGSLA